MKNIKDQVHHFYKNQTNWQVYDKVPNNIRILVSRRTNNKIWLLVFKQVWEPVYTKVINNAES